MPTVTSDLSPRPPETLMDVGDAERWWSIGLGGLLLGAGMLRGGVLPVTAALFGAALVVRGVTRTDPLSRVLRATPAERAAARARGWSGATSTRATVTIARPRHELYAFWRDFTNLPRFLPAVKRIDVIDGQRSRWTVAAPGGATVSWEAVLVRDEPDRRIGWESEEGSDIRNAGAVSFRDVAGGRATEVTAEILYEPPAGPLGRAVVSMFREKPRLQVREGLERLKAMMESD